MREDKSYNLGVVSIKDITEVDSEVKEFESLMDKKASYILRYISIAERFPIEFCNLANNNSLEPVLTWELNHPDKGHGRRVCSPNETDLPEILAGKYDEYLKRFALDLKAWNKRVYIRLLHEFNANWNVWSGFKNGASSSGSKIVRDVWIYIVDLFRSLEVENVEWIWCPHEPSYDVSLESWNSIEEYWPGHDYVDLMGIDGFNFYPENPERENPTFLTFDDLFKDTYNRLLKLSDKDIFIMTGCGEFDYKGDIANKPVWLEDAFYKLSTYYSKVKMLFWFNYRFNDKADWRVNSSRESLSIFKRLS